MKGGSQDANIIKSIKPKKQGFADELFNGTSQPQDGKDHETKSLFSRYYSGTLFA
jgi:hypothetical protein